MHSKPSSFIHRLRTTTWRLAKALLALVLLLALGGALYEARTVAQEAKKYPPPGRLYDLGGYRLHLNCTGAGSPTVVMESGLCRDGLDWSWVQPGLSEHTRVCTYDRAGSGWSDPGPLPRDSRSIAGELHKLLQTADIVEPVVLVGHSAGGSHIQLFEHLFPKMVAGMVLVDVAHQETARPAPPRPLVALAKLLRFTGVGRSLGMMDGKDLPTDVQAAENSLLYRPHFLTTMVEENEAVAETLRQVAEVGTPGSLGDLPLVVLTAAGPVESLPRPASMSLEEARQDRAMRLRLQHSLLNLSTKSRQVFAENSGHQIQKDEPELVIQVLRDLVEEIRQQG